MLTSQRVRPGRVRPAIFPYYFIRASLQLFFCCSDRGYFPSTKSTSLYATTTGSRTGIDLEVVFLVGHPSTLLETHIRSPGLKTRAAMMRRYSSVDERSGCGHEMMTRMLVSMMTWCQDEVHRSRAEIMWVITCQDHVSGHVSRSCEWSRVKIMWMVGLVTMTLQRTCESPEFFQSNTLNSSHVTWIKVSA